MATSFGSWERFTANELLWLGGECGSFQWLNLVSPVFILALAIQLEALIELVLHLHGFSVSLYAFKKIACCIHCIAFEHLVH